MDWYGNDVNGWDYGLMMIGMLVFWGLVVIGVVLLLRRFGGSGQRQNIVTASQTPEQLLAERFASGEIDRPEYGDQLATLREHVRL